MLGELVLDWVRKLCNMIYESGIVPDDWRSAVIFLLCKGKGEMTKCKSACRLYGLS